MRPDPSWRGALIVLAGALVVGCGRGETPAASHEAFARRLVGTWDAKFWLDSERMIATHVHAPVVGTVVFALDRYGRLDAPELSAPTNDGVYDIDFRPFGFSTRNDGTVPVAIAQLVPGRTGDSLYIVLSPGHSRFSVQLEGRVAADSAEGDWRAVAFSAGGGAGRFALRRRRDSL
jgi:hypothetical protein